MSIVPRKTGCYMDLTMENLKPGVKVRVKSYDWYEENVRNYGVSSGFKVKHFDFTAPMSRLCGKVVTVENIIDLSLSYQYQNIINERFYVTVIEEDGNPNWFCWEPEMFECIVP